MKQALKHKLTPFIKKLSTQNILTIIIFVFKLKKNTSLANSVEVEHVG